MPAKSYGIALICSYLPAKQVVTDRLKKKNYEKLVFRKKKSFALEPTTRKHKKSSHETKTPMTQAITSGIDQARFFLATTT